MPQAGIDTAIPHVGWSEFRQAFDWRQGQHVTLIGPTGRGKTTLALELLDRDTFPVVFRTKRRDPVLDAGTKGYRTLKRFEVYDPDVSPRVVLHPPMPDGIDSIEDQRQAFRDGLKGIYRQGGWTPYLDELRYLTEYLGLKKDVNLLLMQGRSLGVGVWSSVQRPRHVPIEAYDQAGHLFLWHNRDLQTQDRLGELGGGQIDPEQIEAGVRALSFHEVLYLNTDNGQLLTTQVER